MTVTPAPTRRHGFVRANAWIILLATVVTVLAAVGVMGLRPSTYTSHGGVVVRPEVINEVPMEPQMGTEVATALSGNVLQRAAELLQISEQDLRQGLSVSVPVDTTVLEITFEAPTARAAFDGASAVTRAYVDYRNSGGDVRVAEVITRPTLPNGPSTVDYSLVVAVALLGGLVLGIAAAIVWDRALVGSRTRSAGPAEWSEPVVMNGSSSQRAGAVANRRPTETSRVHDESP